MAPDVSIVLRPRNLSDNSIVRPGRSFQVKSERGQNPNRDTNFHPKCQSAKNGPEHRSEVGLRVSPRPFDRVQVDERKNSDDDSRRECRFWQKEQKRCQKHGRERNSDGREGSRCGCPCACIEVNNRPREPAGDRKTAGNSSANIRGAKCDELLVWVDALASLGGERLGYGDGFNVPDDADHQCRGEKRAPEFGVEVWERRTWQAPRNISDDRNANRLQLKIVD